nr:PREDICTED: uncharacterized protein LOC105273217 [Fopius arisanus]
MAFCTRNFCKSSNRVRKHRFMKKVNELHEGSDNSDDAQVSSFEDEVCANSENKWTVDNLENELGVSENVREDSSGELPLNDIRGVNSSTVACFVVEDSEKNNLNKSTDPVDVECAIGEQQTIEIDHSPQRTITEKIQHWAVQNLGDIKLKAITQILQILKDEGHPVPPTVHKLLGFQHRIKTKKLLTSKNKIGTYVYLGIANGLNDRIVSEKYSKALKKLQHFCEQRSDLESTDSESEKIQRNILSKRNAINQMERSYSLNACGLEAIPEEEEPPSKRPRVVTTPQDASRAGLSSHENESTFPSDKKKALVERVQKMREEEDDQTVKKIINYFDASFELFAIRNREELQSMKRSQQYDLRKAKDDLKQSLMISPQTYKGTAVQLLSSLGVTLPMKTAEEFEKWEKSLDPANVENQENQDKVPKSKTAFVNFMATETANSQDATADIKTILKSLLTKSIQMEYSGAGKKRHGVGKKNFSATFTYQCMKDFIKSKYNKGDKDLRILTVTSEFLSGACDREEGRAARVNKTL